MTDSQHTEHGTLGGWSKHQRCGTPVCEPCRAVYAAEQRRRRREAKREQAQAKAAADNLNARALWVEIERRSGMPRWNLNPYSDSESEIAARRKVLEDYHTTMEQVG